ncbi:GNAT family N-acetyltransferase [Jeotgalibacillus soli]|uniref:N-acetyltransferase domain-containing protein n=1 Tax=Jeotgalibacillus soli TaxID=889306 RepID=A0A0C2VLC6_9BACL|nr:GNAT family N-acetyltransferase [Jeotgalibacillus soli]KIL45266.1 hypothetical protein KP78_28100 [Jeotgalibacillus soli]
MRIYQTFDYEIIARLNKPVQDLHSKLYPEYFSEYNYDAMKEFFKSLINEQRFIFLIIEDNQESFGYAWIESRNYLENAFCKEYKSIYVHQISILETHRKKGYGSILMKEIDQIAKDKGIYLIELDCWFENSDAKDFYKKHHFTKNREFISKQL